MVNYFAYGSNMSWDDLDKWFDERGYAQVHPGTQFDTGHIEGYRLVFNHYSKTRGGGALNITGSPGGKVCGVLFDLSEEDFEKIKVKEGPRYKPHSVNVFLHDGSIRGAKTFKAENKRELFAPTEEYLNIVLKGAEAFNLSTECVEKIIEAAQRAGYAKPMKGELD